LPVPVPLNSAVALPNLSIQRFPLSPDIGVYTASQVKNLELGCLLILGQPSPISPASRVHSLLPAVSTVSRQWRLHRLTSQKSEARVPPDSGPAGPNPSWQRFPLSPDIGVYTASQVKNLKLGCLLILGQPSPISPASRVHSLLPAVSTVSRHWRLHRLTSQKSEARVPPDSGPAGPNLSIQRFPLSPDIDVYTASQVKNLELGCLLILGQPGPISPSNGFHFLLPAESTPPHKSKIWS